MSGTHIICRDVDTGESDEATIENDYVLICDGDVYLDGIVHHANGTVQLTLKRYTS